MNTVDIDPVLDAKQADKMRSWSKTTRCNAIRAGTFVPGFPISVSGRKKGWFLSEIQSTNAAIARGASEAELKKLAADLEAKRKGAL